MLYLFKKFSVKNWLMIGLIFLLTCVQVAFTMLVVSNVGLLTKAIGSGSMEEVWEYGRYMILDSVLLCLAQTFVIIFASKTASDVATRTRKLLYDKVNAFALSDLANFSTESLITRTTNDIQNIHLALLTALRTVFVAPITMVWSIILLIQQASNGITVIIGIWVILLVAVVIVLMIMVMPKFKIVQKLTDELNVASRENLTGVRVVRAFNAEQYQENKFNVVNTKFTKAQIFTGRVIAFANPFITLVLMGMTLGILWVSAFVISGNSVETAKDMFNATNSFVILGSQIVMSFVMLITLIMVWPRATVCANRIKEILTHKEMVLDPENPVEFSEQGTIEFRNVGFAYPGSNEAVSDISFKVNKGETIAFIGATGSGKTTIINMIPRFADATRGEVLVDGVNVKNVKQSDLRNIIGYTPQRGFLFKGNIRENIAFSNPKMSLNDVIWASKIAEADSFVSSKRQSYDSEVAQGGTNFSGGQKQRLCIARSVAKKPEILIFDDSFSALDYRTDKIVRKNIKEGLPGVTRVIIAQRVGTIMDADQIVVLDKGKIVGLGKHEELIRSCAVYQEIALSQLSKEELGLTDSEAKGGK